MVHIFLFSSFFKEGEQLVQGLRNLYLKLGYEKKNVQLSWLLVANFNVMGTGMV